MGLVYQYFFKEKQILTKEEMKDSVNICVANLPDLIIDYPKGKEYACLIIDKSVQFDIISKDEGEKYMMHIDALDS